MTIKELYTKLEQAYSLKNLNNISLTLINLYKNKQFTILQKIAEILGDFLEIEILSNGKGFSKLIKLYHPDRLNYYLKNLKLLYEENNYGELLNYSHILKLDRIEEISESLNSYEDIDYSPVYEWDLNTDGYSVVSENRKSTKFHTQRLDYNFFDAIKLRQYGNTEMKFPTYYLEDIEDFELASSDISDLDGIQYCIHAKTMDLSDNRITDLELLENLGHLEELNLSDNQIQEIDTLSQLVHLKRLYLANNLIRDISPLLELDELEYIELSGNKINRKQIHELTTKGITIDI